MNEIPPLPEPDEKPLKPVPAQTRVVSEPPSKKFCAFLGFILFLVSSGFAFVFPPLCLLGLIAAIVSLFYEGYRCIFVGYILTIGLILLGVIAYCSTHPFDMK